MNTSNPNQSPMLETATLTVHTGLNTYHKTGLAYLLSNVTLLTLAREVNHKDGYILSERTASLLRVNIENAITTLCDTLTALSLAMHGNRNGTSERITPELVAEFSALVAELMPVLYEHHNNITRSTKPI